MASLNRDKLREAILYFLERANNAHLGVTKLMKLLYFADFEHCEQHGRPITGARYVKLPQGPALDQYDALLAEFEREGVFRRVAEPTGPYEQHRFLAERTPDLMILDASELETLDKVCAQWRRASLGAIVKASHDDLPWRATPNVGDEIDYGLAAYRHPDPDEDEPDIIADAFVHDPTARDYAKALLERQRIVREVDE
jgi:uncharacterized phage-associated protein